MKIIKTLLFLLLLPCTSNAQSNEFSLSYSPLSAYKLGHGVEEGLTETNHTVLGAFNFDYYHYMNNWLKFGVNMMFDRENAKGLVNYGPIKTYEKTNSVFVLAPQVDFEFVNTKKFRLSTGLGVGYAINKQNSTEGLNLSKGMNGLIFHVNLVSFRWGIDRGLCGYMGVGYKGFIGLGYFMRI